MVIGDDTITTPTCDPSDEWKRVTFDFSGSVPGIFDKYQNGAPTGPALARKVRLCVLILMDMVTDLRSISADSVFPDKPYGFL